MIEEITFYYSNGKKETFEVGREVEGKNVEGIEIKHNRASTAANILFKDHSTVFVGVPFSYKTTEPEF